ncbi:hypothetical protein PMAYCL1PPCAC_29970, partial [Pristionchus mayeri]
PSSDEYCGCSVDSSMSPIGWKYEGIWLDVVIVLDTSEAMGQKALDDESLLMSGGRELLVTDSNAPFYTRIGVLAMGEEAQVLYNLNMTKADKLEGKTTITKGLKQINIVYAFEAAQNLLEEGKTSNPERGTTRQVIYYITDSDLTADQTYFNNFKSAQGVIIVNNFLQAGETERQGLKQLASEGYYFINNKNNAASLQAFCKANCFCKSDKNALGGSDPAIKAAGGCYKSSEDARAPFNKTQSECASHGGIIATIHEEEKGHFLINRVFTSNSDYFWLGYSKSDKGVWQWEDHSTDPYTNWGQNEPSTAPVAKCAYVDTTVSEMTWGAGNCQIAFPYICQLAPCSVGYSNC